MVEDGIGTQVTGETGIVLADTFTVVVFEVTGIVVVTGMDIVAPW